MEPLPEGRPGGQLPTAWKPFHGALWWTAVLAGLPLAVVTEIWLLPPRDLFGRPANWFYLQQAVIALPALLFLGVAAARGWRLGATRIAAGLFALAVLWLAKFALIALLVVGYMDFTGQTFR